MRSNGRVLADELAASGGIVLPDVNSPVAGGSTVAQIHLRGGNVQANSTTGDYIQIFSGFRPFVHATQSEVSTAAFGRNIVVTYNDSTGLHLSPNPNGPGLIVDRVMLSGFATSNDGGQTWTSGFMPPGAGGFGTFGDPSVGVDRHGNFFFADLADDAAGTERLRSTAPAMADERGVLGSSSRRTMSRTRNGWRSARIRRSRAATTST